MHISQRRLQIAKFVRALRPKIDAQPSGYLGAIVVKTHYPKAHVVWRIRRRAAISEEQPLHVRIETAALQEKRQPEWPAAEIGDKK